MRANRPTLPILPHRWARAAPFFLLVVGCGSDDPGTRGLRSDGGQPPTVANAEARWAADEAWSVDEEPALVIGGDETPTHQFHDVRGVVRLTDGRVAVGNAGSGEVRFYGPSGEFLASSGRPGAGPEEFRRMTKMVGARADSLAVFDAGNWRISVLDGAGGFARSVNLAQFGVGTDLVGVLGTGGFVLSSPVPLPPAEGLSRDTVLYVLVSPEGDRVDSLVRAPGGQQFQQVSGTRVTRLTVPFGVDPVADARGDQVIVGATDLYAIRQHRIGAGEVRVIQREATRKPFTEAHRQAVIDAIPRFESALREIPLPPHLPAIGTAIIDVDGHLWIQDHPEQGSARTSWSVFDTDGALRGSVDLPSSFIPTEIGTDYVVGIARDELDVERVQLHRLRKP